MNFGFTEEQELLRAEVRKFLDENAPLDVVRQLAATPDGFSKPLWKQMAELGWLGLVIPEAHGGAGLGIVDLVVLLEETGRSLLPSPLLSTTLAATVIADAGTQEQQARWLPRIADGSAIGTLALLEDGDWLDPAGIQLRAEADGDAVVLRGEKLFVNDAASATFFVVAFREGDAPEAISLALVERDAAGVHAEDLPSIDATKRGGRLRLDGARIPADARIGAPGAAWPAVARALDRAACMVTAEMTGAAEAALSLTTGYAKQRIQFGEPIGRFQGVKHPLAEMFVDIESWRSLVYYAAWALDHERDDASLAASRAKAYASDAFARIGIDVVQLHGGIGYTAEYDAQLFLKRAKWARPTFGDADWHYARIAADTGATAAAPTGGL